MPIYSNEGGVIYEHTAEIVNDGGVLYEQESVHANDGGVLYEIFSALPKSLTWSADTSADSYAKINSVASNGFTLSFTALTVDSVQHYPAIYSNEIYIPANCTITVVFSEFSGTGTSKYAQPTMAGAEITSSNWDKTYTIVTKTSGKYRLWLEAYSVTGSSSGVSFYPCTVRATITVSK